MSVIHRTRHIFQGAAATQTIKNDPFGFILDTIIRFVVSFIIPVPFASEVVVYFKGPILALLVGGVMLLILIGFIIVTTLFAPATTFKSLLNSLTISSGENLQVIIKVLEGYTEAGFMDTSIPLKDPFGGSGESYSIRTAGFHSQAYYQQFGLIHEGQDLVPSQTYYAENKSYQLTGQAIVFATLSGKTTTYTDSYGALTVSIINNDETIQTIYKHFSQILTCNNCSITAGQPIGIMGDTGFATGEHLHYEVRVNQEGAWVAVDPLTYIH